MKNEVILGSEIKLNVNIKPINNGEFHAADYAFECQFYTSKNTITLSREQMIYMDPDNYIATIDTKLLGVGEIKVKIIAQIPDDDFDDRLRTEITRINTGINIIK